MKRLRENTMLEAEISPDGTVMVEGHHVGELSGFRFTADKSADGPDAKAMRTAAQKALASEIEARSERLGAAPNGDIVLDSDGTMRWVGAPVARVVAGDSVLKPKVLLLADEQLTGPARDKVVARLERWIGHNIETVIKPLVDLDTGEELEGIARGVAFRMVENLGTVDRRDIAEDVRQLDQDQRAVLRRKGVRFGAYHIFIPSLLKPAPAALVSLLWAISNDGLEAQGRDDILNALAAGRTSMPVDTGFEQTLYRLAGLRVLGKKAVRVDILERLADFIRPATGWRFNASKPEKRPEGAWDGAGFVIIPDMLSILGASHDDMADVLRGLGYKAENMLETDVRAKMGEWDQAAGVVVEPENQSITEEAAPADATSETGAAEKADDGEPQEPKRVDIWRQNRSPANRNHGAKRADNANRGRGKDNAGGKREGGKKPPRKDFSKGGGRHKKPVQEKQPDPDSPFAKLAALKADLTSK